jgi:hypothetical protein
MSRIVTLLSVAIHRAEAVSAYSRTPAVHAISIPHAAAGPVLVVLLVVISLVMLVSRVNSVLIDLVSQLVQVAAAIGRMLVVILVVIVIGSLLLLHR